MRRSIKILLYILTFSLFVFFSVITMIRASFMIPINSSDVNFDRSFTLSYLTMFRIIAFLFGIICAYAFLSRLGKRGFKEVFAYKKRYFVYGTSVVAFGLLYFIFEILFGYIALNINNPNMKVNNTYNSVIIDDTRSYNSVEYSVRTNNTNMFILNGASNVTFNKAIINHYGSGQFKIVGNNTIIKSVLDSNLFISDSIFTVKGDYTEGIYLDSSTLNTTKSTIKVDGNSSVAIFGDYSNVNLVNSYFNTNSDFLFVFRNGSTVSIDNCDFGFNDKSNEFIYLSSENMDLTNKITLKNIELDYSNVDLFKIDKSVDAIYIEDSFIKWDSLNKYLALIEDANVEIHIKNSNVLGNISLNDNSNIKIYLENSIYEGSITDKGIISLEMDDNSTIKTNEVIKINNFIGSDSAFQKVKEFVNLNDGN